MLLLCVLVWFRHNANTATHHLRETSASEKTTNTPSTDQTVTPPQFAIAPSAADVTKRKEDTINAAFLTPITIFGAVLDEQRRPIADATVQIAINDSPNRSGTEHVRLTGNDGTFSLVGARGISFSIRASKNGFYTIKESTAHRNVVTPALDDNPIPTREAPLILTLRTQGNPEPLLHVSSRQIDIASSGEAVSFDLVSGRVGGGQLQIVSRLGDTSSPRFDWSYQLSVPGGGLIERTEEFQFEAPAEGYSPTKHISMSSKEQNWSSDVAKEFFAKLPDGRYARFAINFYPGKRNFVVLESYVNPNSGNRNLEFDSQSIK